MATTQQRATLDDLMKSESKAELIGGRIVPLMATGKRPGDIAANIYVSLRIYAKRTGSGHASTDNMAYAIQESPSGRESFCPDAGWYDGPEPATEGDFFPGPPAFAAEVRSDSEYIPSAEQNRAEKRAEYFDAGTSVVWDVDYRAELIFVYRASDPDQPIVYTKSDIAEAEPAVPGWRISGVDVFERH